MEKEKRTALVSIVRETIRDVYSDVIKKSIKIESKHIAEGFKTQISILQSNNRNLLKTQIKIAETQQSFMKAIPEAFAYMHDTYGGDDKFSPQTYAKMAMNIIKFKTLKFEES